jgi:hypothetical protein
LLVPDNLKWENRLASLGSLKKICEVPLLHMKTFRPDYLYLMSYEKIKRNLIELNSYGIDSADLIVEMGR